VIFGVIFEKGGLLVKKRTAFFIIILIVISILTAGCQNSHGLNPKNPVTITMWHNYGGQMKITMDEMVEEFNGTVGAEKGIIINVTSISSSASLQDKLIMAAKGDPGAPALPDITTAYPKTAIILADKGLLVNLDEQFAPKELTAYVPRFIEEGRLETDKLYVFPTAKSTEVIFLNKSIFDRFAKDAGVVYTDLQTFEGLARTAALYYKWTDDQTPNVANDGKTFYHTDSLFNFTQVGCKQLGKDFIVNNKPDYSSEAYRKVWGNYYDQAVQGYYAIYDGYGSDLAKTGDIVCSTGSTAGVAFLIRRLHMLIILLSRQSL
jgi:multiple sugar transport system substrate-binding protein